MATQVRSEADSNIKMYMLRTVVSTNRFFVSRIGSILKLKEKRFNSHVPSSPVFRVINADHLPQPTRINAKTIEHLERLSLVDFANRAGIQRLEEAIRFADQILVVETDGVEPMISVLEEECVPVRPDEVTEGDIQEEILSNAAVTEEEYFLAPPGNIPLVGRGKDY